MIHYTGIGLFSILCIYNRRTNLENVGLTQFGTGCFSTGFKSMVHGKLAMPNKIKGNTY